MSHLPQNFSKTKWLVNFRFDLIVFCILPLILFFFGSFIFPDKKQAQMLPNYLVVLFFEIGHSMSSMTYVYFDKKEFLSKRLFYLVSPLAIGILLVFVNLFNSGVFFFTTAVCFATHLAFQQIGFAVIVNKKNNLPENEIKCDALFIYLTTAIALCFWASDFFPTDSGFYIDGDIPKIFSKIQFLTIGFFYVVYLAFYIFVLLAGAYKNGFSKYYPKILIQLSIFLVWVGGVVVHKSVGGFWILLNLVHGLPFLYFSFLRYCKLKNNQISTVRAFKFVTITLLLSLVVASQSLSEFLMHTVFLPLLFVPSYLHMYYDVFLWKTKNYPQVANLIYKL